MESHHFLSSAHVRWRKTQTTAGSSSGALLFLWFGTGSPVKVAGREKCLTEEQREIFKKSLGYKSLLALPNLADSLPF